MTPPRTVMMIIDIGRSTAIIAGDSYGEDTIIGETTDNYADALNLDLRGLKRLSLTIKNNHASNALKYKMLVKYSSYDSGDDEEEVPESTLAAGQTGLIQLDHAYSRVKLQVKAAVATSQATYKIDYLVSK